MPQHQRAAAHEITSRGPRHRRAGTADIHGEIVRRIAPRRVQPVGREAAARRGISRLVARGPLELRGARAQRTAECPVRGEHPAIQLQLLGGVHPAAHSGDGQHPAVDRHSRASHGVRRPANHQRARSRFREESVPVGEVAGDGRDRVAHRERALI